MESNINIGDNNENSFPVKNNNDNNNNFDSLNEPILTTISRDFKTIISKTKLALFPLEMFKIPNQQ